METPNAEPKTAHPNYLGVFVLLAILTAAEIGVTYLPLPRAPILIPMAIIKAALVVMYYMHLRYDKRIFTTLFVFGLIFGVGLLLSLIVLFAPPLLDIK